MEGWSGAGDNNGAKSAHIFSLPGHDTQLYIFLPSRKRDDRCEITIDDRTFVAKHCIPITPITQGAFKTIFKHTRKLRKINTKDS